jgi:hypothetical protein
MRRIISRTKCLTHKKAIGKGVGDAVDAAGVTKKISISPDVNQTLSDIKLMYNAGHIGDMEGAKKVIDVLDKLGQNQNADFTARGLKSYLPTIQSMVDSTDDPKLKSLLIDLKNKGEAKLTQAVPTLEAQKGQYSRFMSGGPETLTGGGLTNNWLGDSTDPEGKLATGIKKILSTSEAAGAQSADSLTRINDLVENLKAIENDHPGFLQKININPDVLKSEMQEAGDQFAMSRSVLGEDPKANPARSIWTMLGGASTGRGQLIHKANLAGRAVKSISESGLSDVSRKVYNAPAATLHGIANGLKAAPGNEFTR